MSSRWTPVESIAFEMMLKADLSVKQIAMLTGRSEGAVSVRRSVAQIGRRRPEAKHPKVEEPTATDAISYGRATHDARVFSSIMHLVDLKRAGHSPRLTELRISPDSACPMRMAVPLHSRTLISSPAAMCAEIQG